MKKIDIVDIYKKEQRKKHPLMRDYLKRIRTDTIAEMREYQKNGYTKQIVFHGHCLRCSQQEVQGVEFCTACEYFTNDRSKPDLRNGITPDIFECKFEITKLKNPWWRIERTSRVKIANFQSTVASSFDKKALLWFFKDKTLKGLTESDKLTIDYIKDNNINLEIEDDSVIGIFTNKELEDFKQEQMIIKLRT